MIQAVKKLRDVNQAIAEIRLLPSSESSARSLRQLRRDRFKLLGEKLEEAHAILFKAAYDSADSEEYDAALAFIAEAAKTLQPDTKNYN